MTTLAALLITLVQNAPRIESIELAPLQPHAGAPAVIWYDNFDTHDPDQWKYMEPQPDRNGLTSAEALGGKGGSLELHYARGKRGTGNRKLVFGDSPTGRPLRRGKTFETVYWRIYVKHPATWAGGGFAMAGNAFRFDCTRLSP